MREAEENESNSNNCLGNALRISQPSQRVTSIHPAVSQVNGPISEQGRRGQSEATLVQSLPPLLH
jgi:hypothetical protein